MGAITARHARNRPVSVVGERNGHRLVGPAAVLLAAALWGTVGPVQVLAGSAADPGALGVGRLLAGGAVLALLGPRTGGWAVLLRPGVRGWVGLAAIATGVYQVAFAHAVHELGAALGTAIALGVAPVATGLCARLWTGERIAVGWVLATAAAIAGSALVLVPAGPRTASTAGVLVALVAGACYGVYTVAAKRFLDAGAPALPATAASLLVAGALLSPLLVAHPDGLLAGPTVLQIAWTGLAGTAAAYAAFVFGLRRSSASAVGTLSLAEPALAAVLGVAVLGERLAPVALLGMLLLLAALALVVLVPRRTVD